MKLEHVANDRGQDAKTITRTMHVILKTQEDKTTRCVSQLMFAAGTITNMGATLTIIAN